MEWHKTLFFLGLCIATFALAPPINRLSRAIEDAVSSYRESCILPGTIPDRPDSSKGWKLRWIQTHKELKK